MVLNLSLPFYTGVPYLGTYSAKTGRAIICDPQDMDIKIRLLPENPGGYDYRRYYDSADNYTMLIDTVDTNSGRLLMTKTITYTEGGFLFMFFDDEWKVLVLGLSGAAPRSIHIFGFDPNSGASTKLFDGIIDIEGWYNSFNYDQKSHTLVTTKTDGFNQGLWKVVAVISLSKTTKATIQTFSVPPSWQVGCYDDSSASVWGVNCSFEAQLCSLVSINVNPISYRV